MTPHQLGRTAYYSGVSRSACPYRVSPMAKVAWTKGWDTAASEARVSPAAPKLTLSDWAVIARPQMESVSC